MQECSKIKEWKRKQDLRATWLASQTEMAENRREERVARIALIDQQLKERRAERAAKKAKKAQYPVAPKVIISTAKCSACGAPAEPVEEGQPECTQCQESTSSCDCGLRLRARRKVCDPCIDGHRAAGHAEQTDPPVSVVAAGRANAVDAVSAPAEPIAGLPEGVVLPPPEVTIRADACPMDDWTGRRQEFAKRLRTRKHILTREELSAVLINALRSSGEPMPTETLGAIVMEIETMAIYGLMADGVIRSEFTVFWKDGAVLFGLPKEGAAKTEGRASL